MRNEKSWGRERRRAPQDTQALDRQGHLCLPHDLERGKDREKHRGSCGIWEWEPKDTLVWPIVTVPVSHMNQGSSHTGTTSQQCDVRQATQPLSASVSPPQIWR